MKRFWTALLAVAASLSAASPEALADDPAASYPNRPVRMVVAWPAGGVADSATRRLAATLERFLGVNVVVDNRPGASGQIGAEFVARAPADGYTLLASDIATHAIDVCVFAKLRYDPFKDFVPISLRSRGPMMLVANSGTAIRSVKDVVSQARSLPEGLAYASPGLGSPQHLQMEVFDRTTGAGLRPILFKGEAPALLDVVGGQIPVMITFPSVALPHVQSGKLRPLAVTSARRLPAFPEVPTFRELGWPELEGYSWGSFHAPAGTPRPIVDKLNAAIARTLRTPEIVEYYASFGSEALSSSPEELADWNRKEIERLCAIARQAGIKLE